MIPVASAFWGRRTPRGNRTLHLHRILTVLADRQHVFRLHTPPIAWDGGDTEIGRKGFRAGADDATRPPGRRFCLDMAI